MHGWTRHDPRQRQHRITHVWAGMMDTTEQSARQEIRTNWPIVLAAFLGIAGGISALPYYTQGIFVGPLTSEFGWSREQMSLVTLAGGMLLALLSPVVGSIMDRVGVPVPLALSFGAMILGYLLLSTVGGSFALFFMIQLVLIALGSATGPVSFTRVINEYFSAARGLALGITLAGAGMMAIIAPPLIARVISQVSWRAGYQMVALMVFVAAACSLAVLGRRARPVAVDNSQIAPKQAPAPIKLLAPLVLRLAVTFLVMALGIGGFTFHLVPMLLDAGMALPAAARIQSLIGIALLIGRLGAGALVDRIFAPFVGAAILALAALGIAGIAWFGIIAAAPCAFLIGLALGTEGDVIGYLTARYFGMAAYGRTYGFLYGVFAMGLGLSPVLMARLQSLSQSYETSLWLSCAALTLAALSLISLPSFPRKV
jgi:predicted MFS family arabinose efflux permease